ncbi:MAG: hypothetical protein KGZ60_07720 [Truepera sp.]|nr:hypothetical protein [Truepera sp.]
MSDLLPLLLVLWPLIGALLVSLLGSLRNALVLVFTGVTVLGALALMSLVASERLTIIVPLLLGLTLSVDAFSALLALFASFVWFCVSVYAIGYLEVGQGGRYHTTSLLMLSAMLGIVLAGDLVTLYLFFEMIGLLGLVLVIHDRTAAAKQAALKYLWMTLPGSSALLAGILLVYNITGSVTINPLALEAGVTPLHGLAFGLLLLGFGVKAGMVPLHAWLPDAHSVAPSPASALLSGVMIKAGAYGIFRSLTAIFRPTLGHELASAWQHGASFGLLVLWLGLLTMLVGVVLALKQHDAKRLLAYHSISQMGFVLAGLGAAGYLGLGGAQGQAGGLLHIVNHGLFKAALFLGVGAVALRTGERNLYKLGGLWRQMPLTFIFMLVAAAGIAGIPLFNGFVSKSLIHHAVVEAHPMLPWRLAEVVLIVTSGGTVASFIKLISLTFLGRPRRAAVPDAPPRMLIGMGLLAIPIILLGLKPDVALGAIAAGLSAWGIAASGVETFLQQSFLSVSDLQKAGISTGLGILIYLAVVKIKLFDRQWPFLSHASSTLARSVNAALRKVSPSWWNLPPPEPSRALPSRTLLTSLEQLLMRWDYVGALWLALGALLILAMLGGRGS